MLPVEEHIEDWLEDNSKNNNGAAHDYVYFQTSRIKDKGCNVVEIN